MYKTNKIKELYFIKWSTVDGRLSTVVPSTPLPLLHQNSAESGSPFLSLTTKKVIK